MAIEPITDNDAEFYALFGRLVKVLTEQEGKALVLRIGDLIGNEATRLTRDNYPPAPGRPRDVVYPRKRKDGSTYLSKWKTAKQQGYFFYALARGIIRVPYSRRGGAGLGGSMTYSVAPNPGVSAVITVGTNKAYAPFVIGSPRQAGPYTYPAAQQTYYHQKSGWQPLITQLEAHIPKFRAIIIDALKVELRAYLLKKTKR